MKYFVLASLFSLSASAATITVSTQTTGPLFNGSGPATFDALAAQLDASWPMLADHPSTNDIPANGMTYRLQGDPVTWWVVRQRDVLATQVSAHNAAGEAIVKTINLATGQEEEINLSRAFNANSWNEARGNRQIKTNAAIKARNNK